MTTPIFSKESLDYKLIEPWIIEDEKRRKEEERRKNSPFIPLYAPEPEEDFKEDKPEEKKEKRVIIIEYE